MVWILCIPIVLLYVLGSDFLIRIFMDQPSQEAMRSGGLFLLIVSPFYFVVSVKLVADGILRGSGLMRQFMIATFTDLILRVLLAFLFSSWWGYLGIWCSWPIGWSIATVLSVLYYRKGPWKEKKSNRKKEIGSVRNRR